MPSFVILTPPVFPEIQRIPVSAGREVVMVTVHAGPVKPYVYSGKAYRRIANTTVEMRSEAYNRMLLERMHREQRWGKIRQQDGWSVEDLDRKRDSVHSRRVLSVVVGWRDPGTRDIADLARGLGLLQEGVLLRAAAALFGEAKQIESRMPTMLCFVLPGSRGTDRTEFSR